ncbi:hypothetical protein [Sphaerisporangium sp. TRM90804]|uniref:hypothetical protein n=1 Tax=Sphaerisporangium sp. TRM90804 TaxID=3031113 RepID=UPI00244C6C3B|nr:hypothetical protein [Sphaerisporangium sp. TRM90804]MDH2425734.1 hypothetical protein [Sphaerisporangium sp. TRM90804]
MRADIRSRALGYYRSGAIRVLAASTAAPSDRPFFVEARVRGHHSDYIVRHELRAWTCTCHADGCAHVAAVQLATGHPSAAAPTPSPKGS